MRREQQVQRAGGAQLVPGLHGLARAAGAQADRAERGLGVAVDRRQHVLAVVAQQLIGARAAHVPDAPEVGAERGLAGGRDRLGARHLDLRPVALVVLPGAADPYALALLEVGERPDEHDLVPVVLGVEHGPAALRVREALEPDQDLGRERSSLGVHGGDHI